MTGEAELRGAGVSPGIAVGRALVVERQERPVVRVSLEAGQVAAEEARLTRAVEAARRQVRAIKERLSREVGLPHAYIFDAHLLMLDDPLLLERSVALVREERVNAEWALRRVAEELQALFDEFSDEYLRERRSDVDDVVGRIALNLAGAGDAPTLARLPGDCVLVADELGVSEAAELDWARVLAVVVDGSARTSHAVILARSRNVPAVVGLRDATRRVRPGSTLAVDGSRGLVVVEPSPAELDQFRAAQALERAEEQRLEGTRVLPAATLDGVRVSLQANVEFMEEVGAAARQGAEGIGLFRSEYLLGAGGQWPGEDRQVEVYRRLLSEMSPHPVVVRTWDVGPDEIGPVGPSCANPALGERALRLLRRNPEPFRTQLRALLRASAHGPIAVMFPFVGGLADLHPALQMLQEARGELQRAGQACAEHVRVGINVEIPGAALCADALAREVDFFAIGTNDLIQYLLAVDRSDPRVAHLFQPLHPAVLRVLDTVARAGRAAGIPVSACGEMAAEPLTALALVGVGVRELSMTPAAIPRVKAAVRRVHAADVEDAVRGALALSSAAEVEQYLRERFAAARAGPAPPAAPAGRARREA